MALSDLNVYWILLLSLFTDDEICLERWSDLLKLIDLHGGRTKI